MRRTLGLCWLELLAGLLALIHVLAGWRQCRDQVLNDLPQWLSPLSFDFGIKIVCQLLHKSASGTCTGWWLEQNLTHLLTLRF